MRERRHKHEIELSEEQRFVLQQLISSGKAAARQLAHARIFLKIDRNAPEPRWTDTQIAEAFEMSRSTVIRVRERFVNQGLDDALNHRPHTQTRARALDGEQEAHLIALSCSPCPVGQARWTLTFARWSDGGTELYGACQPRNCAQDAKKNELKPWLKQCWCIAPEVSAAFVWRMEDVLDVYTRRYDYRFPQVCMDENAKLLLHDKRESLPLQPGHPERVDYIFESGGMRKIFLACEPLIGQRYVKVTEHRASQDWASFVRELVDVHYPDAEKIVLVMDNLNTHTPSSLSSTFAPAEARRILQKLEIHYTLVHGSWLNMAEIELSALARQCLSRRIGTQEELEREVQAWQQRRNSEATTVNWRFTTADARIKLKRLYPSLEKKKSISSTKSVAKND